MDYAQEQRNPTKHLVGIVVVVLLHIALVYALVNGLARKVVEVIKKPLETQIIEEVRPPPPPPVSLPPPPKFVSPPPPYIPPPEVQINVPPPPNAIQTTTSVVPTVSPPIAVVAPPAAPPAPSAPPAPAPTTRSACPNYATVMGDAAYPRDAVREGIDKGEAVVRFTVSATGEIKDIVTVSSTNRVFARQAQVLLRDFKCIGQGRDLIFEIPFVFKRD